MGRLVKGPLRNKGRHVPQKAAALSPKLWSRWLQYVREHAGSRMFVLLWFTGAVALRCTEACQLKREDINDNADVPFVQVRGDELGQTKTPGKSLIRLKDLAAVRTMLRDGVNTTRELKHKNGVRTTIDTYKFPAHGRLFRARGDSGRDHLEYHAVTKVVSKLRPGFMKVVQKEGGFTEELTRLRTHSGRASAITDMMCDRWPVAASMKQARHKDVSVHLAYGQLTVGDLQYIDCGNSVPRTSPSIDILPQLWEMHKSGALTPEEFQKAKERVLEKCV